MEPIRPRPPWTRLTLFAAISTMTVMTSSAAAPPLRTTHEARPHAAADGRTRLAARTDPSLPELIEPGQTQVPDVYRLRREAVMKEMGEGVAVVYANGSND